MIPTSFNFTQYTCVDMTWYGCMGFLSNTPILLREQLFDFFIDIFYSFNFLSNNYIREKYELVEKWIFVRIFRDKDENKSIRKKR